MMCSLAPRFLRAQVLTFLTEKQADVAVPKRGEMVVSFAVEPKAGLSAAALRADVIAVSLDARRRDDLRGTFTTTLDSATATAGPMLRIDGRSPEGFRSGVYELVLNVRPVDPVRTAAPSERHTLRLTLAGATLRPLPTLVVSRTLPALVVCCGVGIKGAPLVLEETGRHTRISSISLATRDVTHANGEPVTGRVVFTAPEGGIEPGASVESKYSLTGDFPIGKVTGNADIGAPELATALSLKYEVTTKRSRLAIIWIIALGLLFGWMIRVGLEFAITRNTTRLQALRVIQRIAADRAQRKDGELRGTLDGVERDLRRVMTQGDATALTTAITKAEADRAAAIQAFEARQLAVQTAIDKLEGDTSGNWSVPPAMSDAIREVRGAAARARTTVATGDLVATERSLDAAREAFTGTVAATASDFRRQLLDHLAAVDGTSLVLPAAATDVLKQVKDATEAIPTGQARPDATAILGALHAARSKATLSVEALGRVLESLMDGAIAPLRAIDQKHLPAPERLGGLAREVDELQTRLRAGAAMPESVFAGLRQQLDRLREILEGTLDAQTSRVDAKHEAANKPSLADIAAALKAGKYAEASTEVAKFVLRNAGQAGTSMMGGRAARAAAVSDLDAIALGAAPEVTSTRVMTHMVAVATVPESVEDETARTLSELARAKIRQTVLAGILITFAGYVIFHQTFTGTVGDIAVVFFWAFTLDVSVATLTALAGKVSPPR